MILIISCVEDVHVLPVTRHLDEMAVPYKRIDPAASEQSFFEIKTGRGRYQSSISGSRRDTIALARSTVIWYRRPTSPGQLPERYLPDILKYVNSNRRAAYFGLLHQLPCDWLPATPMVHDLAGNKTYQLSVANELGFFIPLTRISAAPEALLEMYSRSRNGIVIKSLMPFVDSEHKTMVFTRTVDRRELRRYLGIRYAPVIIQERIEKRSELRITVVGEEVFAAEIHSQANSRARIDFRRASHEIEHRVHKLPAAVAKRCVDLTRQLGLRFAAIDMILTPEGKYVFLEINPNGQWLWIENATGLPIAEAIARLLAECHSKRKQQRSR